MSGSSKSEDDMKKGLKTRSHAAARFFSRTAYIFLFVLLTLLSLEAAQRVPVPLDHWSYPVLEYFAAKRILIINLQTKPVTREAIACALETIRSSYMNGELPLDGVEDDLLASLFEEFSDQAVKDFRNTPRSLVSTPPFALKEASSISGRYSSDNGDRASFNTFLWARLGGHLSVSEHIRVVRKGHPGSKDTLGTRAWKDFRGTTPIALFTVPLKHFTLNAGRMTPWLGPGRFGTLLLSNHYPYYDGIHAEFTNSTFRISSYFIVVNVDSAKYFAGHRLELIDIWGTTIGLSECIIFSNRTEPGYLNPLLILYGEQYNRGDRDNMFWALDVSRSLFGTHRVYAEFLIDDFQYESSPPAPNKIGFLAGIHLIKPLFIPRCELLFEYTKISKWTYTHKYQENTYSNYRICIGHDLGPDADRIDILLRHYFRWNIIPQAHFSYIRRGEGRLSEPWEREIDPSPPFPSGVVMYRKALEVSIFFKPFPSSEMHAGWNTFRTENCHNREGWIEQDNAFSVDLTLTF